MKSDKELLLELEHLVRQTVEVCRTLAYRQQRTGWIRIAGMFEDMLLRITALTQAASRIIS